MPKIIYEIFHWRTFLLVTHKHKQILAYVFVVGENFKVFDIKNEMVKFLSKNKVTHINQYHQFS